MTPEEETNDRTQILIDPASTKSAFRGGESAKRAISEPRSSVATVVKGVRRRGRLSLEDVRGRCAQCTRTPTLSPSESERTKAFIRSICEALHVFSQAFHGDAQSAVNSLL
jgi:hypothetical protein